MIIQVEGLFSFSNAYRDRQMSSHERPGADHRHHRRRVDRSTAAGVARATQAFFILIFSFSAPCIKYDFAGRPASVCPLTRMRVVPHDRAVRILVLVCVRARVSVVFVCTRVCCVCVCSCVRAHVPTIRRRMFSLLIRSSPH